MLRGPRVDPVIERVRRSPFRTSLLLHLLPVGSFTAVNLLAGSLRVPYVGFLLGTALGLMPGMVLFVLLAQQPGKLEGPRGRRGRCARAGRGRVHAAAPGAGERADVKVIVAS